MPNAKRVAFPVKIGEHVTLRTDLLLRTALWTGKPESLPMSPMAGSEGRVVSLNISDREVYVKGIGWTPLGDLIDPNEISWEDDDIIEDVDDPILEDDDDDIIFED